MYKNIKVMSFNVETHEIGLLNKDYMPLCIRRQNEDYSFDSVKQFCSLRVLLMNRAYCKELLTSCGVEDQSDINICIISRALSFRDNYWIKSASSEENWDSINLYTNCFSVQAANVALTGVMDTIDIGSKLYTGELSGKGTRPKCFIRRGDDILLFKAETIEEIKSEIISAVIASVLGLKKPTRYWYEKARGRDCSVCRILTSERSELVHYRDVMSYYSEVTMSYDSSSYQFLFSLDPEQFLLMQLFDYVTLNTDRNRDNFGIEMCDNKFVGLYPVYDHDSCFKGISTKGSYFPTGLTFDKTIEYLKSVQEYQLIRERIRKAVSYFNSYEFQDIFLKMKSMEIYESMRMRIKML